MQLTVTGSGWIRYYFHNWS